MNAGQKAIFFDIDGTLYDRDNPEGVPDSARFALDRLRENGHKTFICTGRVSCAVEDSLRELGFDGMILGCGTHIFYRGRQLFYHQMDRETGSRLVELVAEYGGMAILEGKDYLYCDPCPPDSEFYPYYKKRQEMFRPILRPVSGTDWEISKMTVRFSGRHPESKEVMVREVSRLADVIDSGSSAEFVPKGFSKASGIAYILEKLGINREDTVAFGDGMNDLEMLSYVGLGIAMGNSAPEILDVCGARTDAVYEDGVYKACVRYGLI